MTWQQFLTEKVLGGCWHELTGDQPGCTCKKCGAGFSAIHYSDWNPKGFVRTFTTRNDLMDLYEAVAVAKLLPAFGRWLKSKRKYQYEVFYRNDDANVVSIDIDSELEWLFCLNGKDYENRCKMVAEFYGWNEQRDPVIDKNSGAYGDN